MKHVIKRPIGTFQYYVTDAGETGKTAPAWKSWVVCEADTMFGPVNSTRYFKLTVQEMDECFKEWAAGKLIQHAFPRLDADDREWLLTGESMDSY